MSKDASRSGLGDLLDLWKSKGKAQEKEPIKEAPNSTPQASTVVAAVSDTLRLNRPIAQHRKIGSSGSSDPLPRPHQHKPRQGKNKHHHRPPPKPSDAEVRDIRSGLDVYRAGMGATTKQSSPKLANVPLSAKRTLAEVVADSSRLRIRSPDSNTRIRAKSIRDWLPKFGRPASAGSPAIIGFDFGTAFTKVVVQWRRRHYVVDWFDLVEIEHRALLPSVFSEGPKRELRLGRVQKQGWLVHEGLKLRLIAARPINSDSASVDQQNAALFMALALFHVREWFEREAENQGGKVSSWRINVGLPALPWQEEPLRDVLHKVAQAAWKLSSADDGIDREAVKNALQEAEASPSASIAVIAEFAAQLASYLESPQREQDLHAMVDVGAGTVDFVAFNAHWNGERNVLPIASSLVERLGSHFLLAASAGKKGEDVEWHDKEAGALSGHFAQRLSEGSDEVDARRTLFAAEFRNKLGLMISGARGWYRTSVRWRQGQRLPVFFCGGGADIEFYRSILSNFQGQPLEIRTLLKPQAAVGPIEDQNFHRVSVAYGLSLLPRNLGEVLTSAQTDRSLPPLRRIEFGDRDDDR